MSLTTLARVWWGLRVYGPVGVAGLARRLGLDAGCVYRACYRLRRRGHADHDGRRRTWDASGPSRAAPPYPSARGLFAGRQL